jgi:hypothetical protein
VEDEDLAKLTPIQKAVRKLRAEEKKDHRVWLTPKEAGNLLGCGQTTIRRLMRLAELGDPDGLPNRLFCGRRLILKSAVFDRLVAQLQATEGASPSRRGDFPGKRPHEIKRERKAARKAKKPEPVE